MKAQIVTSVEYSDCTCTGILLFLSATTEQQCDQAGATSGQGRQSLHQGDLRAST